MSRREEEQEERRVQAATRTATAQSPPLDRIFTLHHRRVANAAYRVTGNSSDAEDVLQTVFLRLLRRVPTDPPETLGPYLHRAAVNASLDLLRRRRRQPAISLDEDDTGPGPRDLAPTPDHVGLGTELRQQLRQAIAGLSPRAAEIFVLRYLEGYGNKEIAGLLGTTQSTVGVTLHRVREQLKKDLGTYLGEPS